MHADLTTRLTRFLTELISETSGLTLQDTLTLGLASPAATADGELFAALEGFQVLLDGLRTQRERVETLLAHPVALALRAFFRAFPLPNRDEHIHLTGSLAADFLYPRLAALLAGPDRAVYEDKIRAVYGDDALPIRCEADVDRLIRLREGERFDRYLKILYLPKLVLTSREAHRDAAYHMASRLYRTANVGALRLKFTLFRETTDPSEQIPGLAALTPEDVVLGLREGFELFRSEMPAFRYILSPSFRKEPGFYDAARFATKKDHFDAQVDEIISLLDRYPDLRESLREVDTVGNERGFYRKADFQGMRLGFRKLQARGFSVRSHHGETWRTLRHGVQAVDNAMNIWHVDAIEHGLSLGINPNFYYHRLMQRVMRENAAGRPIAPGSTEHDELFDLDWNGRDALRDRFVAGERVDPGDAIHFTKAKFHHAREVETYQHDVLNRMIDKRLSLIALPSSNKKLTGAFETYQEHPFSWWEKKGLHLGVGTDNDVTLNTDYLRELLILLCTDSHELKITKLLIVATGETRRSHLSHLLWEMRKQTR
jgi:adenosine deaminase